MTKNEGLEFRSIKDPDIKKIHEYQNSQSGYEISWVLDIDMDWVPETEEKIKEKIEKIQKNDKNHIFAVWKDDAFIGLVMIETDWDPVCPNVNLFIWPEFRRKGYGKTLAHIFLDKMFNQYHGHMVATGSASYYEPGLKFIESLGFKPAGRMRRTSIHNGQYADWVCYDILKSEYLEQFRGSY